MSSGGVNRATSTSRGFSCSGTETITWCPTFLQTSSRSTTHVVTSSGCHGCTVVEYSASPGSAALAGGGAGAVWPSSSAIRDTHSIGTSLRTTWITIATSLTYFAPTASADWR